VQKVAGIRHLGEALTELATRLHDAEAESLKEEAKKEIVEAARLRMYSRKVQDVLTGDDRRAFKEAFSFMRG